MARTKSTARRSPWQPGACHSGGVRRYNRRYDLRPSKGEFLSVPKSAPEEQVKPNIQNRVRVNPENRFPQFSRLPQELRLKIWGMVTDEPRAVIIHSDARIPTRGFRSPASVPAAMQVCIESREIALKKYELAFSAQDALISLDSPARVWFNFESDMVYFRDQNSSEWDSFMQFRTTVLAKDLQRIRFLGGLASNLLNDRSWYWPAFHEKWLKDWKDLEVIYYCHEGGRVNISRPLIPCKLPGNPGRKFLKPYRLIYGRNGRFKGLSISAALEKIKIGSRSIFGNCIPEIDLIRVVNP